MSSTTAVGERAESVARWVDLEALEVVLMRLHVISSVLADVEELFSRAEEVDLSLKAQSDLGWQLWPGGENDTPDEVAALASASAHVAGFFAALATDEARAMFLRESARYAAAADGETSKLVRELAAQRGGE